MRKMILSAQRISYHPKEMMEGSYEHLFINKKLKKPYVNIAKVWAELRAKAGWIVYASMTCAINSLASW